MNASYLELSEQLDCFFPASLHKIRFQIFQIISKCSIYGLRPFKYKNKCDIFDKILDKDNRGRIMVKKCFVLHEEVIYVFHDKFYIPTIENCHLILLMSGLLVQFNTGRL